MPRLGPGWQAGRVFIDGEDVTPLSASRRNVTMVFRPYALSPHLTVFENVASGLRVARRPGNEIARRVGEALETAGLPQIGPRFPPQLSGGQSSGSRCPAPWSCSPRRSYSTSPSPTSTRSCASACARRSERGSSAWGSRASNVTHDQSEALALSDLIVVMSQGRVEQVETPAESYRKPASRFVADFVGAANLLPGAYADGRVTVGPLGFEFHREGVTPGPVTVMARPEAITVRRDGEGCRAACGRRSSWE